MCKRNAGTLARLFKLAQQKVRVDCYESQIGIGSSIINLSMYNIDQHERAVLEKGLKYVPYEKATKSAIMEGYRDFSRKIKLSYFFHTRPSSDLTVPRLYREKSSWLPEDKYLPPELIEELELLRLKLDRIRITSETPNMSPAEYRALECLSKREDLVFKKADKGSSIVIMDKENYIEEALSQLNKPKYYQEIPGPIFKDTFEEVNSILDDLQRTGWLDPLQVHYLRPKDTARERLFYTLPKVHKSQEKWPKSFLIPPGRPVVSDVESDSHRIGTYIDDCLKPISDLHPSYIRNTDHFLEQLRSQAFHENCWLVAIDVESLYTNIQPGRGLQALQNVYERSGINIPNFPQVKKLLEISLKNNDFKFGDKYFKQIFGCSMGKVFSPTYANIFLADWERDLFYDSDQIKFYKRFLDDGFMIYQGSMDELLAFLHRVNNHDDSINVTWQISAESNTFCDVTVFKGNRFFHHKILDTKLYVKPTDTHELLDKTSYHPRHVFSGIVKSQLVRYLRICNNMSDFHEATSNLFKALREKRHYSKRFLRQIKSDFLLKYREVGDQEEPMGAALKCGRRFCECCLWIKETSYILKHERNEYDNIYRQSLIAIEGGINCQSQNVIYVIECKKCEMQYVGETRCNLKTRLQRHLSDIRTRKDTSVAIHFNYDCVSDLNVADLIIYPIEIIPDQGSSYKNEKKLLMRESFWIKELNSLEPFGLNRKIAQKRNINVSMTYSDTASRALKVMRESYEDLKAKFPKAFNSELMLSYKRNRNISEYLVHAKL